MMGLDWPLLANVGSFLQGIAGVATLITILFFLRQTKEMARQTRINTFSTISGLFQEFTSSMINIQSMIVEYSDLRLFFYGSRPIAEINMDSNDYQRILILAEMLLDSLETLVVLKRTASESGADEEVHFPLNGWMNYLRELYKLSPAMQVFFREHSEWYDPALGNLLSKN